MTKLAKLDSVRTLKDAPPPGTATTNSVADTIEQLKTMTGSVLREQYNKASTVLDYDTESAYGATTDNSSTNTNTKSCKPRCNKKGCKAKDTNKLDENKNKNKTTKHFKKFN